MPTVENIIKNCIQDLCKCAAKSSSLISARAEFVSYELQSALERGDLQQCQIMIEEQIELLSFRYQQEAHLNPLPLKYSKAIPEHLLKTDTMYKWFSTILLKAHRQLRLQKVAGVEDLSGVTTIHRIWLGKMPSEERLLAVASGNKTIMKHWYKDQHTPATNFEQIIWTNNKNLLAMNGSSAVYGITVRPITELFTAKDSMFKFIESFIQRDEFALAADLLRFIILKYYGGLFVGMPWRTSVKKINSNEIFCPKLNTVRAFFIPEMIHDQLFFGGPFEGVASGYFDLFEKMLKNKTDFYKLIGIVDSDLLYVGCPHHPFIEHCLNITEELLSHTLKMPGNKYFSGYRMLKYKKVSEIWEGKLKAETLGLKTKTQQTYTNPSDLFADLVVENLPLNVTIITHVFSLTQSLIDLGYMNLAPFTDFMKQKLMGRNDCDYETVVALSGTDKEAKNHIGYTLTPQHCFPIHEESNFPGFFCPILGISRFESRSWLNLTDKNRFSVDF